MDDHCTTYTTAAGIWRRGGVVEVVSSFETPIASFPVDFLATSGDNTWAYVYFAIGLVIRVEEQYSGRIKDSDGLLVSPDRPPQAGIYTYIEEDKQTDVVFARGPEYFNTLIPPSGVEESSRSGSSIASRSRPDQASFRELLVARDSVCPITGDWPSECQAAHLVPASRPDVYMALLGRQHNMFGPEVGVLLNTTLNKAYDALRWSFYYKDGVYHVHYFTPSPRQRAYHGKAIPVERFNPIFEAPDPSLTNWHYAQAVRMRIRGFSVGMHSRPRGGKRRRDDVLSEEANVH